MSRMLTSSSGRWAIASRVIRDDNASHAAIEEQPEPISRALIDFARTLWPR